MLIVALLGNFMINSINDILKDKLSYHSSWSSLSDMTSILSMPNKGKHLSQNRLAKNSN